MQLTVNAREKPGVIILDLGGRLVAGEECDALRTRIKDLLATQHTRIILNLQNVSRIDSTAIGMLVEAVINTVKQGGQIKLVSLPRLVHNVLFTHRLLQAFEVHATEEEALAGFKLSNPSAA